MRAARTETVSTVSHLASGRSSTYTFSMSLHSYSRVWMHLVWATLERRPLINKAAAAGLSTYLTRYAGEKEIYMKINFVNPDHVHALVDLPTSLSIEEMMQFFKGASSHWINQNGLVPGKFGWGRGYGVFSVSHSGVGEVAKYIAKQEEHHRKRSYSDELRLFVERYGLKWREEKTVETVPMEP
jgi:REP element-mobilizing transposase RayT